MGLQRLRSFAAFNTWSNLVAIGFADNLTARDGLAPTVLRALFERWLWSALQMTPEVEFNWFLHKVSDEMVFQYESSNLRIQEPRKWELYGGESLKNTHVFENWHNEISKFQNASKHFACIKFLGFWQNAFVHNLSNLACFRLLIARIFLINYAWFSMHSTFLSNYASSYRFEELC